MIPAEILARPVAWAPTGRAEYPFAATVDGAPWLIRLNDFPADSLYTLLVGGRPVGDFDDWPGAWRRG